MANFDTNQPWSERMQQELAMPLYSDHWGVPESGIEEVDKQGTNGDSLAKLLDKGGVDKIIKLTGNLMVAQRLRRASNYEIDFTIRRQAIQNYDAEYMKLKRAHQGDGTAPSKYAYGEVNKAEDGFRFFYIVDLDCFLELEFSDGLQKKRSPSSHNTSSDPFYWENQRTDDNGFYAWAWDELESKGLIEAKLSLGERDTPDNREDITQWLGV